MRGRKPNPVADHVVDPLSPAVLADKGGALAVHAAHSMQIAEQYGDGMPYDRHRLVTEARFFMATSAEAMLELGRRLVQIKENEPHGDFIDIVTEQLGIGVRSAQQMMAASVRYLSLNANAKALAHLGKTKLFDLMAEADEDLEALAEGGTLAGLALDDMQAMTSRELKAALVEARKANAAKDAVIAKKDQKLNKLAEAEALRRNGNASELEAQQLDLLRADVLEAEPALLRLVATVDEVMQSPATQTAEVAARQALDLIVQRIVDSCLERGITVDLAERVSPIFMAPVEEVARKQRG